jgi:hypothetical protein
MPRSKRPFFVEKRNGSKTYLLTLSTVSGLPDRICKEWYRKSFQNFPRELAAYSNPKTKAGALAFINHLKKRKEAEGSARRVTVDDITVGAWIEKFTTIETSPRTGINASRNRPYSPDTIDNYKSYRNYTLMYKFSH